MSDPKNNMEEQINQNADRGSVLATDIMFKGIVQFKNETITLLSLPQKVESLLGVSFNASDDNGPIGNITTTVEAWNIAVGDLQPQFHIKD